MIPFATLQHFLLDADAQPAAVALNTLSRHNLSAWALTGGFATELHLLRRGCDKTLRPLNDIDFIVGAFGDIPETLASDFLFRHVHPGDPPNKTLLQMVDADRRLRIDAFRAPGETMARTVRLEFAERGLRMISLEDLTARAGRLSLDLREGVPVPRKYAEDFLRLAPWAEPELVERAWLDHRKPVHPQTFKQAAKLLVELIASRQDLLVVAKYSSDVEEQCARCVAPPAFPLADATRIVELLGYC